MTSPQIRHPHCSVASWITAVQ